MSGSGDLLTAALQLVFRHGLRIVDAPGRHFVGLDEEALIEGAIRRAGQTDFGGDEFRVPLRRLLRSLESEADLNLIGRIAARTNLLGLLVNRLQLQRDRVANPEIQAQAIARPLFIGGMPRSGSTLLHGLLAQDPSNRVALNWELMRPSPPPERSTYSSDPRIAITERQIGWFHHLAPDFRRIHPVGARLPEECVVIHSHSFLSYQFSSMYYVPSYQSWMERQDLRPAYELHRRFLQHLQWHCSADRWVLKAPPHLPELRALFAVYPDANVVLTHRDPLEVVASVASLHYVLRKTFSNAPDPLRVGPEVSGMLAGDIERGLRARDGGCAAEERFFDVRYRSLVADPLGMVRSIYARFDLPLTSEAEERMRRYLAENPQHKEGRHNYSLAQFGLDVEQERARYRDYRERFGV